MIFGTLVQSDDVSRCFFQFFKILFFWVVKQVQNKSKKQVQNKKFYLSHFISREQYIIWLPFMVHLCKMIISPSGFSIFVKILGFWVVRGVKGQKTVQNDKKLCLLHSISQEPYIIWLSSMVHICKMIISLGFCFIFSNFLFFGFVRREKVQKMVQNDKKFSLSCSVSQEPYIMWL